MADDMDSDAYAGLKRRVTDTPTSLQQQNLKESSITIQESMETQVSFSKNAKDQLEFNNNLDEENNKLPDFGVPVEEQGREDKESMKLEVGLFGIQESIVEGGSKESMAAETETLLVAEKKRLKIQVIDDTAIVEYVQVPRIRNGCFKDMGTVGTPKMVDMNQKKQQQVDGKKAKRSKKKAKDKIMVSLGMSARLVQDTDSGLNNGERVKVMYSREEMEALRYINIVQQRKLWRDIYTGLGPAMVNEYDNLASSKHQKQILKSFDPRMCFSSKSDAFGILGVVAARARRNHFDICLH